MRKRNAIAVPGGQTGPVEAIKRVYAAVLGRNDEPDHLPDGWQCFGTLPNGHKLYGRFARNPRWRFDSIEDMRRRWG